MGPSPEAEPVVHGAQVAIVGAGIGGLALACALQLRGIAKVTVFERSGVLKSRGGHIAVWQDGLRVISDLGVSSQVAKVQVGIHRFTSWYNGKQKFSTTLQRGTGVRIMREALQRILIDRLLPGTLRMGAAVQDIHGRDGMAEVVLADGTSETFDLVFGADGLNSVVADRLGIHRRLFVGKNLACFARGRYRAQPNTLCRHFVETAASRFRFVSATGGGFDGEWDYVGVTVRQLLPISSEWDNPGSRGEMLDLLKQVPGGAPTERRIVEQAERVFSWGIYETAPMKTWVSKVPPVVLLGDAAHAMAPYMGRGANEALLDAWSLAEEMGKPDQTLEGALLAYEGRRKEAAELVQMKSKEQMNRFFGSTKRGDFGDAELHVETCLEQHRLQPPTCCTVQ